jgi:hypothetical protein
VLLPELDPENLWLFVFGPGVGELVVVRAPPGAWLVVDGCRAARVPYAEKLLDHYRATPDIVVLTHPIGITLAELASSSTGSRLRTT